MQGTVHIIWALLRENLSSRFSTKLDSNQPAQLLKLSSRSRYDTFQSANNKGTDQTAKKHRLVCPFVVGRCPKTGFLTLVHISKLFMCKIVINS